jgi:hypothetical protein
MLIIAGGIAAPSFRQELKHERCRGQLTESSNEPILNFYNMSETWGLGDDGLTANHITAYFALKYLDCIGERVFLIHPEKDTK